MSLIRREALARLHAWREPLAGLALLALGLWLLARPGYVLPGLGAALCLAGLGYGIVMIRRARFLARDNAPGVVQVVEGEISYLGPHEGGFMALDEITWLALSGDGRDWLITAESGRQLVIPRGARGAEALFDAFATLDGLDVAQLLRQIAAPPGATPRPIWRRGRRVLLT
ncbi:MAG: hypothetical protein ACK4LQ_08700 [Pararhodobacter sp.]